MTRRRSGLGDPRSQRTLGQETTARTSFYETNFSPVLDGRVVEKTEVQGATNARSGRGHPLSGTKGTWVAPFDSKARFILRLRLTRVPPDSRGGTCPWQFPAAKLVLPEKEHSSIIKFLTPTITCGPDPWRIQAGFPATSRPAPRSRSPGAPLFTSAPSRRRPAAATRPEKWKKSGQEKRPHYKSDSSA